jgi:MFS family permease
MTTAEDEAPATFKWLPPGLRPPAGMTKREEKTFLLVGVAALFAGFDQNVYGLAIPQIQASLHIPENEVGLTVTFFRFAAIIAMGLSLSADVLGRRRLLLITIFGQAAFTLATAFAQTYPQFVWLQVFTRVFGYSEEMLCGVVVVEEVAANVRGWAAGTLAALDYLGAGVASLFFAAVTILPGHWRALYVIGGLSLFFVAILRRQLPETKRFEVRHQEVQKMHERIGGAFDMARRVAREYPGRIAIILIIVAAWGFAIGPGTVLGSKYIQQSLGFKPWQATAMMLPGGLFALGLNILTGSASDRLGRKLVVVLMMTLCGLAFAGFYSGVHGWVVVPLWIAAFYAFFTADSLMAGFALEIIPTAYRATIGGLRYTVEIMMGGLSLGLEGLFYDHFHAHGPAISVCLLTIPIAVIGVLFLPEPAGKVLEDISRG